MFSKSQKPNNLLTIELDLPRMGRESVDYFTAGDAVCGNIKLVTTTPQPIGAITLQFYGVSKSYMNRAGSNGSVWVKAEPWLFLCEKTWTVNRVLQPGHHQWNFHSRFPRETDPDLNAPFEADESGIYKADKHPLPPTCHIKTAAYALQTENQIWYAVDATMTLLGADDTASDPVCYYLNYTPLRESNQYETFPSPSLLEAPALEKTFACRSVGLLPGRRENTHKLSLHDKTHNLLHMHSTPTATFSLGLHFAKNYAIGAACPILLTLTHNPDGKTHGLELGASDPEIALTKLKITINAFSNVRGSSRWNGKEATADVYRHVLVDFTAPKDRTIILSSAKDTPNDLTALAFTDGEQLQQEAITWPQMKELPPQYFTYNSAVVHTFTVELEVMCAGRKFELEFNKNLRKQDAVLNVLPGYWRSQADEDKATMPREGTIDGYFFEQVEGQEKASSVDELVPSVAGLKMKEYA